MCVEYSKTTFPSDGNCCNFALRVRLSRLSIIFNSSIRNFFGFSKSQLPFLYVNKAYNREMLTHRYNCIHYGVARNVQSDGILRELEE